MTDNHHQSEIITNRAWQGVASSCYPAHIRFSANVTKADFNRDLNVDVRSISGERVQARHYEIPEAIAVNGDENQEHRNDKLIVDARPLPWYIRIDLRLFCCLKIIFIVHIGCEFTY